MKSSPPGRQEPAVFDDRIRATALDLDRVGLPDPVAMLNGVHVVMVAFKVAGEVRYRRRFYVNLNAAQRAVDRAVERGHAASITLCTLAPASGTGWTQGGDAA